MGKSYNSLSELLGTLGPAPRKRRFEEDEDYDSGKVYKTLLMTFNETRFRRHMTRWIVSRHIPFTEVEDEDFRAMLREANPTVNRCLVKGDTIRSWVVVDYKKAQEEVRGMIATARSRIHISFDLWTSPNGLAIVAAITHFIGLRNEAHSVLIGIKRIVTRHCGVFIGNAILPILHEYSIGPLKLGVFIADNASTNDVAIGEILRVLRPEVTVNEVRGRCLAHIINLTAKAYLFGKDAAAFKAIAANLNESNPDIDTIRTAQAHWKKQGAVEKLHNVVVFIRASPQRRESFKQVVVQGEGSSDK